jgi:hypothetical protein
MGRFPLLLACRRLLIYSENTLLPFSLQQSKSDQYRFSGSVQFEKTADSSGSTSSAGHQDQVFMDAICRRFNLNHSSRNEPDVNLREATMPTYNEKLIKLNFAPN